MGHVCEISWNLFWRFFRSDALLPRAAPRCALLLRPSSTFYYLQEVPTTDGWKTNLEFGFNSASVLTGVNVMQIRSLGRDAVAASTSYSVGPFVTTDYNQDIVWADGYMVSYPGGVSSASGS